MVTGHRGQAAGAAGDCGLRRMLQRAGITPESE